MKASLRNLLVKRKNRSGGSRSESVKRKSNAVFVKKKLPAKKKKENAKKLRSNYAWSAKKNESSRLDAKQRRKSFVSATGWQTRQQ